MVQNPPLAYMVLSAECVLFQEKYIPFSFCVNTSLLRLIHLNGLSNSEKASRPRWKSKALKSLLGRYEIRSKNLALLRVHCGPTGRLNCPNWGQQVPYTRIRGKFSWDAGLVGRDTHSSIVHHHLTESVAKSPPPTITLDAFSQTLTAQSRAALMRYYKSELEDWRQKQREVETQQRRMDRCHNMQKRESARRLARRRPAHDTTGIFLGDDERDSVRCTIDECVSLPTSPASHENFPLILQVGTCCPRLGQFILPVGPQCTLYSSSRFFDLISHRPNSDLSALL
eukprot:284817369_1